jgi:hypothetical protein
MNKTVSFPLWTTAQIIAQKFPFRYWAILAMALSGGIGFVSMAYMLSLPQHPPCARWFLPITSASMRFYCAQVAAETKTPERILQAIAFLRGLPPSHGRFQESQQKIGELGMALLNLADQAFQRGELEQAFNILENIPQDLPAYQLIEDQIWDWQDHWQRESTFYGEMEKGLRQSRWNSALIRASGNLNITGFVENKYRVSP